MLQLNVRAKLEPIVTYLCNVLYRSGRSGICHRVGLDFLTESFFVIFLLVLFIRKAYEELKFMNQ